MTQPFKDAVAVCKTILRNGFDAYVINSRFQVELERDEGEREVDIATDMLFDDLVKLFPNAACSEGDGEIAVIEEAGTTFRFHEVNLLETAHPEALLVKTTPRLQKRMESRKKDRSSLACPYIPRAADLYEGFADMGEGRVRLSGEPGLTLKRNLLYGIRALRFAANYDLPIEENTWVAIVRSAQRILDYVPVTDIMDEWRKVEAESMWRFVQLLFDSMILHGLLPQIAALTRLRHIKNETGVDESVFDHVIQVMRRYPEELPFDWYGTLACLFHDIGKIFTAEYFDDKWHFHQHHRVGAQVTRKILGRLRLPPEEMDLICHLVRHHMRFQYMLTERGARRFMALEEYPRLVEMARADIKAREGNYTNFNHNVKMLEKAKTPEEMSEPLLNGKEIMECTGLTPGPAIGLIRDALLQAQIEGKVRTPDEAVEFVLARKNAML
ncbi:metal dependent phosphohydrolase [Desulfovibrio sp. X2]|uniref:HD domain-containing protein n=1 Tax=Desulfovibrio sp. X2 TaxID=941449 RepID=UPI000358B7E6|nr:HD domain-containing protein [Desulfovibrio sp. X2]EPR41946.1 metal dependent phosphohydrolase [Desulfovibrio sp. X2]